MPVLGAPRLDPSFRPLVIIAPFKEERLSAPGRGLRANGKGGPAQWLEGFRVTHPARFGPVPCPAPAAAYPGSTALRRGADMIVKRKGNGHYVFFSVRDDADNGTIVDFLQRRQHLSLGAVRQILRPWIGRPAAQDLIPVFPLFSRELNSEN